MLIIGQQAPDFTTSDINGKVITLQDYKNKKLMLCFFRYAGCPFCADTFLKLLQYAPEFSAKNLHIIAFFQSPKESIEKYILRYNAPFPLISDAAKEVYATYEIQSSILGWPKSLKETPEVLHRILHGDIKQGKIDGDPNLLPASFLIGPPELTIHKTHYGNNFLDTLSLEDIHEFLQHIDRWNQH